MSSPTVQFYRGLSSSTVSGVAKVKSQYQQLPQLHKNLILLIGFLALIAVSSLIVSLTVGANGAGGLLTSSSSDSSEQPAAEQQPSDSGQSAPAASESVTEQGDDVTVDNDSSLSVQLDSNSTTNSDTGETQSGASMTVNGQNVSVPNSGSIHKRVKTQNGSTNVNISVHNSNSGDADE